MTPLRAYCYLDDATEPQWFVTWDGRLFINRIGERFERGRLTWEAHGNADQCLRQSFPVTQQARFKAHR
jgi:hypothetical protein